MNAADVQPGETPLSYAKRMVARFREHPVELEPGLMVRLLDPEDGERFAHQVFARLLFTGRIDTDQAANAAGAGDPLFFNALAFLGSAELKGEIRLLEPLRGHVIEALANPPKLKAGHRKESYYFRDVALTMIVQEICARFGLKPTSSSGRACGCSIAGNALGMTYEAARKSFDKYGRHI